MESKDITSFYDYLTKFIETFHELSIDSSSQFENNSFIIYLGDLFPEQLTEVLEAISKIRDVERGPKLYIYNKFKFELALNADSQIVELNGTKAYKTCFTSKILITQVNTDNGNIYAE